MPMISIKMASTNYISNTLSHNRTPSNQSQSRQFKSYFKLRIAEQSSEKFKPIETYIMQCARNHLIIQGFLHLCHFLISSVDAWLIILNTRLETKWGGTSGIELNR